MKAQKLYLSSAIIKKKGVLLSLIPASVILFLLVKLFFKLYLNNPDFHIFIQSKGIFL